MRLLSFAVAALAVIALVVGQQGGSAGILGLGAVGLLLAFATFRATEISTFLKIFSVVFAVEYVATGAGAVLAQAGFWPEGWQAIAPPASLPTTIASSASSSMRSRSSRRSSASPGWPRLISRPRNRPPRTSGR
jgi:putative ATP-binding cassette transporter